MHLKLLQWRMIQKTAETTANLIGKKVLDKITKVSITSPQNSSKTVENKTKNTWFDKEILKERYISLEESLCD